MPVERGLCSRRGGRLLLRIGHCAWRLIIVASGAAELASRGSSLSTGNIA